MKKSLLFVSALAALSVVGCQEKEGPDPFVGPSLSFASFSFEASNNPSVLLSDVTGVVSGNEITLAVPADMDCKSLVATFETTDEEATVSVGGVPQVSGETVNDFTVPVDYVVSFDSKHNYQYTVKVTRLPEAQWSAPVKTDLNVGSMSMVINPVSGEPVIGVVENVSSSRGPLKVFNGADLTASPVQVSASDANPCQHVAVGADAAGKIYAFTNDYASTSADRKGNVYSSVDGSSWTKEVNDIDYSNAYYGRYIGCVGDEVYVMTSNNAAGAVPKRNVNVTSYKNTWTTGQVLCGRPASNTYFPVIRVYGDAMYVFVTNVGEGLSIYKYQGAEWSDVITVNATEGDYAQYGFGIRESQDMAIGPDGAIYLALGTTATKAAAVVKIDANGKLSPVGSPISTASNEYCRIAVDELGRVYLAYRNDDDKLCATSLDDDTMEWKTSSVLSDMAVNDVYMCVNAKGVVYLACSTDEVFKRDDEGNKIKDDEGNYVIEEPAHILLYTLK